MLNNKKCVNVHIVGVALNGRSDSPVIVLECKKHKDFLSVPTTPFDAEAVIRDFTDDNLDTAVSWLASLLTPGRFQHGRIGFSEEGDAVVTILSRVRSRRVEKQLPLGEGLILCRKLEIPLEADPEIHKVSSEETSYLKETQAFREDFLYLTPPQHASSIPLE